MRQKFCTVCGTALSEGKKFCENCGTPVDPEILAAFLQPSATVAGINYSTNRSFSPAIEWSG